MKGIAAAIISIQYGNYKAFVTVSGLEPPTSTDWLRSYSTN